MHTYVYFAILSPVSKKSSVLRAVLFTILIDMLGIGILIPVIPQLLTNPMSPAYLLPVGWTVQQGYILLGFLTAIFPLMQFIATPILGELSDRFGRKPVLAISLLGTSISYVLFAVGIITHNLPLLFIARAFDGVTGGNIAVAQATLADITAPADRAKTFGLMGAVFGIGFILGPFIGGKLADPNVYHAFGAATPFWFAAILALVNAGLVWWTLPETNLQKRHVVFHITRSIQNIGKAFRIPKLRGLFTTSFLFISGFTFFTTFFAVFLVQKFEFSTGGVGNYFAYVGIWIAIAQALVTRAIGKRFGEISILRVALAATGVFILLQVVPHKVGWLYVIVPFFAIANGLVMANLNGLISRSAGPDKQGEILGINASVQALAQSIPPILAGYLAASTVFSAPIIVSAILIVISGIVFIALVKKSKHA